MTVGDPDAGLPAAAEVEALTGRWLETYGRAWESADAELAASLFSEDGLYAWGPFDELRGREAIAARWRQATADQSEVSFSFSVLGSTPAGALARWRCLMRVAGAEQRVEIDGVALIALDSAGLCTEFREWWAHRELPG